MLEPAPLLALSLVAALLGAVLLRRGVMIRLAAVLGFVVGFLGAAALILVLIVFRRVRPA